MTVQAVCTLASLDTFLRKVEHAATSDQSGHNALQWIRQARLKIVIDQSIGLRQFIKDENGVLLPKLFWPIVRKNCSSDREKLLKFEAEAQQENIGI